MENDFTEEQINAEAYRIYTRRVQNGRDGNAEQDREDAIRHLYYCKTVDETNGKGCMM